MRTAIRFCESIIGRLAGLADPGPSVYGGRAGRTPIHVRATRGCSNGGYPTAIISAKTGSCAKIGASHGMPANLCILGSANSSSVFMLTTSSSL
jgi:hypothetical protein